MYTDQKTARPQANSTPLLLVCSEAQYIRVAHLCVTALARSARSQTPCAEQTLLSDALRHGDCSLRSLANAICQTSCFSDFLYGHSARSLRSLTTPPLSNKLLLRGSLHRARSLRSLSNALCRTNCFSDFLYVTALALNFNTFWI